MLHRAALNVEHGHSPRFDSLDFKFVRPEKSSADIRPSRLSTRAGRDDLAQSIGRGRLPVNDLGYLRCFLRSQANAAFLSGRRARKNFWGKPRTDADRQKIAMKPPRHPLQHHVLKTVRSHQMSKPSHPASASMQQRSKLCAFLRSLKSGRARFELRRYHVAPLGKLCTSRHRQLNETPRLYCSSKSYLL
jgi:hypothetical protein